MPTMSPATGGNDVYRLTFEKLRKQVQHALSTDTDTTLTSLGDLVNEALQLFANMHPWTFLETSATLSIVGSQRYVVLPDDFGLLRSLRAGGDVSPFHPADLDKITRLRAYSGSSASIGGYLYAVTYAGQGGSQELPVPRLELFPTPAENAADAINLIYVRQIRQLVEDDDVPDMPPWAHQPFARYARAHALISHHIDAGEQEMALALGQIDQVRVRYDGGQQDNLGPLRGSVEEWVDEPTWLADIEPRT